MGQDRQAAIAKDLGRARARLEKAVRREAKLRTEWLDAVDEESPGRDIAEAAYPHVVRERDDARAAVERLEEALDAEPPPTENAMLDAYSALRDALRGGGDIGELNERLRAKFQEFRLDRVDDVVVGVVPVLRPSAVELDVGAAFREWKDAGAPEPELTPEEVDEYYRLGHQTDPIWVHSRPPLKVLSVFMGEARDSQEYHPLFINGPTLPPLRVAA